MYWGGMSLYDESWLGWGSARAWADASSGLQGLGSGPGQRACPPWRLRPVSGPTPGSLLGSGPAAQGWAGPAGREHGCWLWGSHLVTEPLLSPRPGLPVVPQEASWPEHLQGTFLLPPCAECGAAGLRGRARAAHGAGQHHRQGTGTGAGARGQQQLPGLDFCSSPPVAAASGGSRDPSTLGSLFTTSPSRRCSVHVCMIACLQPPSQSSPPSVCLHVCLPVCPAPRTAPASRGSPQLWVGPREKGLCPGSKRSGCLPVPGAGRAVTACGVWILTPLITPLFLLLPPCSPPV